MKSLLIVITLLFPISVFCQPFVIGPKNQLKFSPVKMIDPSFPGIEMSYERRYSTKLPGLLYKSRQVSFLYITNMFHIENEDIMKGFRTSFEEKLFFEGKKSQRVYISLGMAYLRGRYSDEFQKTDTVNVINYIDTVSVTKQTVSLNVKLGIQFLVKPFVFELSGGVGVRYRNIHFNDKSHPEAVYVTYEGGPWGYNPGRYMEGRSFTLSVPLNIQLGIIF
jgi:hypothetical protein